MMRSIIVLSLALLLVACKHEKEYSGNPIVEGWYADPEGVVFDDEYWIYPTLSDIPFGADSADFPGCPFRHPRSEADTSFSSSSRIRMRMRTPVGWLFISSMVTRSP